MSARGRGLRDELTLCSPSSGVEPSVQALWSNISSRVPSIQPRGTPNGDWTGVVYNRTADPDCWVSYFAFSTVRTVRSLICSALQWTFGGCTTPKLAGLVPDTTTCLEPNTWGLTIDDGPNCTQNAYHDFLLAQNLKATLFYIGSNVENWPLQVRVISRRGSFGADLLHRLNEVLETGTRFACESIVLPKLSELMRHIFTDTRESPHSPSLLRRAHLIPLAAGVTSIRPLSPRNRCLLSSTTRRGSLSRSRVSWLHLCDSSTLLRLS